MAVREAIASGFTIWAQDLGPVEAEAAAEEEDELRAVGGGGGGASEDGVGPLDLEGILVLVVALVLLDDSVEGEERKGSGADLIKTEDSCLSRAERWVFKTWLSRDQGSNLILSSFHLGSNFKLGKYAILSSCLD